MSISNACYLLYHLDTRYTPSPFASVAQLDSRTGQLGITDMSDLECEGKEGSIGSETIQCWQTDSDVPIIRTYNNVKTIRSSGRRRLRDDSMDLESANTQPRSLLANPSATYNCIKSNLDVSINIDLRLLRIVIAISNACHLSLLTS